MPKGQFIFLNIFSWIACIVFSIQAKSMESTTSRTDNMDGIEYNDKYTTQVYEQAEQSQQMTPLKRRFLEEQRMTVEQLFGSKKAFEDHLEKALQQVLEEEGLIPDEGDNIKEK